MTSPQTDHRQESNEFQGFTPLTANYIYCPNQFFEVCLPHCSRGAVRIVAFILRETLGYLDKEGNPKRQNVVITYNDLVRRAGVSRGAIGQSLKEAVDCGFISCQQKGIASAAGKSAQSSTFSLRWNREGEYSRKSAGFSGFYAGEGHRTPVPNQFFDEVIRNHPLSVAKVVGTVIRHTVGYQNQFGGRRTSAPLSQQYIAKFSGLSLGKAIAQAIQTAELTGFIQRVDSGCFSYNRNEQEAVRYSVRWSTGSKIPVDSQFKNPSRSGSKIPAEHQFKNPSTSKTKKKDNYKQQRSASSETIVQKLIDQGVEEKTASKLVEKRGVTVVEQQIKWLDARSPENRPAMLSKAIDENWSQPKQFAERERRDLQRRRDRERDAEQAKEESEIAKNKQARVRRKQQLLSHWNEASADERQRWIQAAVENEASKIIADVLRRESTKSADPHVQVLDVIAAERNLPPVIQAKKSNNRSDLEVADATTHQPIAD